MECANSDTEEQQPADKSEDTTQVCHEDRLQNSVGSFEL